MTAFTVICPCGACHRHLTTLQALGQLFQHWPAVARARRHWPAQMMPDELYDELLAATLADAEAALA